MTRLGAMLSLVRWLGPWTAVSSVPPGIVRETWSIPRGARAIDPIAPTREGANLDAYVYTPPRASLGTYLVAPGLHFAGPDDPRLDRFCRVLAAAGFVVVAPFLPAYLDLHIVPSAPDDFEELLVATHARWGRPASIFSLSFGSWLAFLAASRRPTLVAGVVAFGGYADFESVARFAVDGVMIGDEGPVALPHDPLDLSVVFLNLVRFLDVPGGTRALEQAWRTMCRRTWGRAELRAPGRLRPFVDELAADVPPSQRELFRTGVCGGEGARELVERALGRGRDALAYASPHDALARIRCPVTICHGLGDDVIPWGEALKLERALSPHTPTRLHLTGLYAHTTQGAPKLRDAAREAMTLLTIASTIAHGGEP